jgi:citrate synthase
MFLLKEEFSKNVELMREQLKILTKEKADRVVSQVTLEQLYGGMRGIKCIPCETSVVELDKGLIIRNISIKQLADKLPEEIFFLLLTGTIPSKNATSEIQSELGKRSTVPNYVWDILKAMPRDSHPMCMFNTAILVMEKESIFRRRYDEGMKKEQYWEPMLEDSLNLLARLPAVAAGIYRMRYDKGDVINPDKNLDWGANYAKMLGIPDPQGDFAKLIQLYLTLHSDHESGNVSAFTSSVVNSALSDIYYTLSAGLNGLAGPLHGLANQECVRWLLELQGKFHKAPTKDQLLEFATETLCSGKVVPGYGHAVLRVTDPRFELFLEFGKKYCADNELFQLVQKLFEIVPVILPRIVPKVKDPWPNVDAISGSLLYSYGLTEMDYYTVMFGVSRALGICTQSILARALGYPITRPKSVDLAWVKGFLEKQ